MLQWISWRRPGTRSEALFFLRALLFHHCPRHARHGKRDVKLRTGRVHNRQAGCVLVLSQQKMQLLWPASKTGKALYFLCRVCPLSRLRAVPWRDCLDVEPSRRPPEYWTASFNPPSRLKSDLKPSGGIAYPKTKQPFFPTHLKGVLKVTASARIETHVFPVLTIHASR
jgi:hypothetical protein